MSLCPGRPLHQLLDRLLPVLVLRVFDFRSEPILRSLYGASDFRYVEVSRYPQVVSGKLSVVA